ncbi:MAG: phage tail protein [Methanobrevibacter sp.]|uniref:phage tail protein n=1 Tax=Methanobrevibacter sp. TaxID=66852 RepID=UPI0031F53244|nr:phage tail protein [Methanobrevibacter sp.]
MFTGRVLNDEVAFNGVKNIECEGELSYFIDTIQREAGTLTSGGEETNELKTLITFYITSHNNDIVDDKKKFTVGDVNLNYTIKKNYDFSESNYSNTQDCIKKLISEFGGYLICRHENNTKYIDYIDNEHLNINTQIIEFGKNIIDMTQFTKASDVATALIVKGSNVDLTSVEEFTDGTIKHDANTDFIYDTEAVKKYGWIFKYLKLDDVNSAETLLENAKKQLNYYTKPVFSIELTAIDLHLLNVNVESIKIGDKIEVLSMPHGLDLFMIVNNITINMDSPENTKVELIHEDRIDVPTLTTDKIVKIDNIENNVKNEVNNIDNKLNNQITDYDNKLNGYDNKFTNYDNKFIEYDNKTADFNNKINELNTNMGNAINTYLGENLGTAIGDYLQNGGSINLSEYAKVVDVNSAFNELATLLNGV